MNTLLQEVVHLTDKDPDPMDPRQTHRPDHGTRRGLEVTTEVVEEVPPQ